MNRMAQSHWRKSLETGRYALLVDRQLKRAFEEQDVADEEARRIRSRFPHLHVAVEDRGPAEKRGATVQ